MRANQRRCLGARYTGEGEGTCSEADTSRDTSQHVRLRSREEGTCEMKGVIA